MNTNDKTHAANQRLLNEAWAHLSVTRRKSVVNGMCSYGGSGCAASPMLLADARELARGDIYSVMHSNFEHLHDWAKCVDRDLAYIVQSRCHDNIAWESGDKFVKAVKDAIVQVCEDHGYTLPWEDQAG